VGGNRHYYNEVVSPEPFPDPHRLSPQHVCDCGFKKCCSGGWPEWTFQFAQLNKGVAPLLLPLPGQRQPEVCHRQCLPAHGQDHRLGEAPAADPALLMKTVSMHPAMVLIRASASFLVSPLH